MSTTRRRPSHYAVPRLRLPPPKNWSATGSESAGRPGLTLSPPVNEPKRKHRPVKLRRHALRIALVVHIRIEDGVAGFHREVSSQVDARTKRGLGVMSITAERHSLN